MAPDQKKAGKRGRSIVIIDETGFMLQPLVRRTWAPSGKTPVQYSWDRRDRLSVISAITVAPKRRRLGLYFQSHRDNIHWEQAYGFVRSVCRSLRRHVVLVLDRWSVHRAAVGRLLERYGDRIDVEWLPPYAPDLNPVDHVWGHTKYSDLANYIPEDIETLGREVKRSLARKHKTPALLRSFFKDAGLDL